MQNLNQNKVGLILGSFLGLYHFAWSMLVMTGLAQRLLDWVFYLHFLNNPFYVADFSVLRAIMLVAVTFAVGYFMGWVLALLWNRFHK